MMEESGRVEGLADLGLRDFEGSRLASACVQVVTTACRSERMRDSLGFMCFCAG